jgi:hypothetical protein
MLIASKVGTDIQRGHERVELHCAPGSAIEYARIIVLLHRIMFWKKGTKMMVLGHAVICFEVSSSLVSRE